MASSGMKTEPPDDIQPESEVLQGTPREILKLSNKAEKHASSESAATENAAPADDTAEVWYEP
jgi:hypothetical protein